MTRQFTNLDEVIKELNAPTIYEDGEIIDSQFEFEYRIVDDVIQLYDKNENYNYNYLSTLNYMMEDAAWEFGFDFEPITKDEIMDKLLEAVKKDFGNETFIEWQDYTIMNIDWQLTHDYELEFVDIRKEAIINGADDYGFDEYDIR